MYMMCSMDDLMRAEDVAKLLGYDHRTVNLWCREGKLPAVKFGMRWFIRRGDLEAAFTPNRVAV